MRISTIVLIMTFFITCKSNHNKIEYYKSGAIRLEYETNDEKKNGKCVEYFENGKIASLTFWRNDTINGEAKYYYDNNNIKIVSFWKNGKSDSIYKEYFESGQLKLEGKYCHGNQIGIFKEFNSNGSLKTIRNYLIIDGKSYLNEVYSLNSKGDTIISKSNFYKISYCCDTLRLGGKFKAKIQLVAPHFSNSKMYVYFEIPTDTINYRRLFSGNYVVDYDFYPNKPGNYMMKGFIDELKTKKTLSDSIETKRRRLYFETKYYVR